MQARGNASWLKVNFWVGAVFDAAVLIPMLSPAAARALFGITDRAADAGFRYAMFLAAALMAGWTCLLVWAAQRPLERRAIALLTVVPVLGGLVLAGFFAVETGFISLSKMVPTFLFQGLLGLSYLGSYLHSRRRV